jgi:hypothetical protein
MTGLIPTAVTPAASKLPKSEILKERRIPVHWTAWIVVALAIINAGWMVFDGTRALTVGDYVTPQTGEYAGQLGPWSSLVKAMGIEPRSTLMKLSFVAYGVVTIFVAMCFALELPWAGWGMVIISVWYLPVGTIMNMIVLVLLVFSPLR